MSLPLRPATILRRWLPAAAGVAAIAVVAATTLCRADDPLPSWNEGPTKKSIVEFVTAVTTKEGPTFVPERERIATFDNDGTLWSEQPLYFQVLFTIDRLKALSPKHPEWKDKQPFKALLEGDLKTALAAGDRGFLEVVAV